MLNDVKPENANWRHYFGGLAFLMIILQLLTGLFLIFFYEPTLTDAYKTVQRISNQIYGGGLIRNLHRWVPALLFIAILVHTIRCFLRMDFVNQQKRVLWLTGVLLLLPILFLIITGLIIPWEWKGYWFLEMLTKLRKRGIFRYLLKHAIVVLPFLILLAYLAITIQIPSADPEEVPLPLDGANIIVPEWYFLIILLPFMYLKNSPLIPFISIIGPLVVLFVVAFMPYYLKGREVKEEDSTTEIQQQAIGWRKLIMGSIVKKVATGIVVTLITFCIVGLIYLGSYNSPTFGCNSCHNLSKGERLGKSYSQML